MALFAAATTSPYDTGADPLGPVGLAGWVLWLGWILLYSFVLIRNVRAPSPPARP